MSYYQAQPPQPNFQRALRPLRVSQPQSAPPVSAKRALLHLLFIVLAFGSALAGSYWLSTPAAGMALTVENLSELPMMVAVVGNALFLSAWAWAVVNLGERLGLSRRER